MQTRPSYQRVLSNRCSDLNSMSNIPHASTVIRSAVRLDIDTVQQTMVFWSEDSKFYALGCPNIKTANYIIKVLSQVVGLRIARGGYFFYNEAEAYYYGYAVFSIRLDPRLYPEQYHENPTY